MDTQDWLHCDFISLVRATYEYPRTARNRRQQGTVMLYFVWTAKAESARVELSKVRAVKH